MKKALILLLMIFYLGTCADPGWGKMRLSMVTGGAGGVYFPLGQGIAKLLNEHLLDVETVAEEGNGSTANVNLVKQGIAALAFVQNDVAFRAVNGMKPFREPVKNLRLIASLYPEQLHCVTFRGSGIKNFSDLKGRRVSAGAPGSGVADTLSVVLSVAGWKYSDMDTDFYDFSDTIRELCNDELDVGFLLAGYPVAALSALTEHKSIDLVALDALLLEALSNEHSYLVKDVIPAGTYKDVNHDTPTVAAMALLVCNADLPGELAYGITKTIFENLEKLWPAHEVAKRISLDTALLGASLALHPGAVKYYTEKGLEFPKP